MYNKEKQWIISFTYTVTVFKFAAILFRVFVIWSISRLFMFAFRRMSSFLLISSRRASYVSWHLYAKIQVKNDLLLPYFYRN